MGMFDNFEDLDGKLTCAAGHKPTGWQTKAFESTMTDYFLYQGKLYVRDRGTEGAPYLAEDGTLRQPCERIAVPVLRTVEAAVCTHCRECEPVLHTHGNMFSRVGEREPWCEYVLTFVRGKLDEVKPFRLETREDVIREMKANGSKVIDDDSPTALAHKAERRR